MAYTGLLLLHIVAAVATVGLVGYALVAMARSRAGVYRTLAFAITAVATFEVVTGVVLIMLAPELNAVKVGAHMALYLGACLVVNIAMYLRARTLAWTS